MIYRPTDFCHQVRRPFCRAGGFASVFGGGNFIVRAVARRFCRRWGLPVVALLGGLGLFGGMSPVAHASHSAACDSGTDGTELTWTGVVPDCLHTNDEYRILVLSHVTPTTTGTDIAAYNAEAQSVADAEAAPNSFDKADGSNIAFSFFGSTQSVDARDNTDTNPTTDGTGERIFWYNGNQVAATYNDLYTGGWDSNQPRNLVGNPTANHGTNTFVFTGTSTDGTGEDGGSVDGYQLGRGQINLGRPGTNGQELDANSAGASSESHRFMMLSEVLVAESAPALTASAAIGVTNPASLSGANLHGATMTVVLTGSEYVTSLNAAHFILNLGAGLAGNVTHTVVRTNATTATLTLSFPARTLASAATLGVRVIAGAQMRSDAESEDTPTVTVAAGTALAATITGTTPTSLTDANVNTATMVVRVSNTELAPTGPSFNGSFTLNLGGGFSAGDVTVTTTSRNSNNIDVTLTLAYGGGTLATDGTISVSIAASGHTGSGILTTGMVTVASTIVVTATTHSDVNNLDTSVIVLDGSNLGGSFVQLTITDTDTHSFLGDPMAGVDPAPVGSYTLALGGGLTGQTVGHNVQGGLVTPSRSVLGLTYSDTLTTEGTITITIVGGAFSSGGTGDQVVTLTVAPEPAANIGTTVPATLDVDDGNFDGARVPVVLSGGGVGITLVAGNPDPAHFTLNLGSGLSGVTVTDVDRTDDTTATLTLGYAGTLAADSTLAVTVAAAAHSGSGALTTAMVAVGAGSDTRPVYDGVFTIARGATIGIPVPTSFHSLGDGSNPLVTGGDGDLNYSLSGALPTGLQLLQSTSPSGRGTEHAPTIIGTVATSVSAGTTTLTLTVTDADGDTATRPLQYTVAANANPTVAAISVDPDEVPALTSGTVTVSLSATPADTDYTSGDELTHVWSGGPAGATFGTASASNTGLNIMPHATTATFAPGMVDDMHTFTFTVTDLANNTGSGTVTVATVPVDDTPPGFQSPATIPMNGETLTLTYDEALNEMTANRPPPGAFTVSVTPAGGGAAATQTPGSVMVSGSTVTLGLDPAVRRDDTVTVSYTPPGAMDDPTRLEDLAGNDAVALTDGTVTNGADSVPVLHGSVLQTGLVVGIPTSINLNGTSGGDGILTFSLSGNIPPGVTTLTQPAVRTPNDAAANPAVLSGTPTEAGNFAPTLTVTDSDGSTATATVNIGVNANPAPTVTVTTDLATVPGGVEAEVTLTATVVDNDGDQHTYLWAAQPGVVYGDDDARVTTATFTRQTAGTVTFSVTVTDLGGNTVPGTVNVAVNNIAPTANAGAVQTVTEGDVVTLDGSGSRDETEGGSITLYAWSQAVGDPEVTLSANNSADAVMPTFTAPDVPEAMVDGEERVAIVLTFSLTVTDNEGAQSAPATVRVTVEPRSGPNQEQVVMLNETIAPQVAQAAAANVVASLGDRIETAIGGVAPTVVQLDGQSVGGDKDTVMLNWLQKLPDYESAIADGTMDWKRMLRNSSFALHAAGGGGTGGGVGVWGNGSYTEFEGDTGDLDWNGDSTGFQIGMDTKLNPNLLVGAAVSSNTGQVNYDLRENNRQQKGDYTMTLTGIHPYLGWSDGDTHLWGSVGYSAGEVEIDPEVGDELTHDTTQTSIAGGFNRKVSRLINVKGDVSAVETELDDSAAGMSDGVDVGSRRARLLVEARDHTQLANGGTRSRSFDFGYRADSGDSDADTDGVEWSVSMRYHNPAKGVTIDTKARALIGTGDYEEWGLSGLVRLNPSADGQGLAFSVEPAYGDASGNAGDLWHRNAADTNTANDYHATMKTRLGYGLGGERAITPYTEMTTGNGNNYRLGVQWSLGKTLDMNLFGEQTDDNAMRLEGKLYF